MSCAIILFYFIFLIFEKIKNGACIYMRVCVYEITSSCIFASSFAVLDIIFSAPLSNNMNVVDLSHLVLGLVFYSYFRYKVLSRILYIFCVCL